VYNALGTGHSTLRTNFSKATCTKDADRSRSGLLFGFCVVLISCYLVTYALLYGWTVLHFSAFGTVVGRDFVAYYSASVLALHGNLFSAFDLAQFFRLQAQFFPGIGSRGFLWLYPATFGLFVLPLALLPPLPAFAVWSLGSISIFAAACWKLWHSRWSLALGLANSATLVCLVQGQNALICSALFALLASALLQNRQSEAGAWAGLLAIKPHIALLIPIGFAAGRYWRAFFGAATVVAVFLAISTLVFGFEYWGAFLHASGPSHAALLQRPGMWERTVTIYSALRSLGVGLEPAMTVHFTVAFAMIALITFWWMRRGATQESIAAFIAAGCLVPPYLVFYDLALLSPAVILLSRKYIENRTRLGFVTVFLIFIYCIPLMVWLYVPLSSLIGFLAPLLVLSVALYQVAASRT
jgi:hypothetical protein